MKYRHYFSMLKCNKKMNKLAKFFDLGCEITNTNTIIIGIDTDQEIRQEYINAMIRIFKKTKELSEFEDYYTDIKYMYSEKIS